MEIPALERPSLPRVADSHTAHSMSMLPVLFLKSRIISRHRHFQQKRFPHNQQAHQNNKVTSKVYFRQSFDQIYITNWTGAWRQMSYHGQKLYQYHIHGNVTEVICIQFQEIKQPPLLGNTSSFLQEHPHTPRFREICLAIIYGLLCWYKDGVHPMKNERCLALMDYLCIF